MKTPVNTQKALVNIAWTIGWNILPLSHHHDGDEWTVFDEMLYELVRSSRDTKQCKLDWVFAVLLARFHELMPEKGWTAFDLPGLDDMFQVIEHDMEEKCGKRKYQMYNFHARKWFPQKTYEDWLRHFIGCHRIPKRRPIRDYIQYMVAASEKLVLYLIRLWNRSQNPLVMKKSRRYNRVRNWTYHYRHVQNLRRVDAGHDIIPDNARFPGESDMHKSFDAKQLNATIGEFMRTFALTAPQTPEQFEYLWRGMHGVHARELMRNKKIKLPGYIAATLDPDIALNFAHGNYFRRLNRCESRQTANRFRREHPIILRIRASSVPKGTPWIFFTKRPNNKSRRGVVESFAPHEREVLLPPGELRLTGKLNRNFRNATGIEVYDAIYTPIRSAIIMAPSKSIVKKNLST